MAWTDISTPTTTWGISNNFGWFVDGWFSDPWFTIVYTGVTGSSPTWSELSAAIDAVYAQAGDVMGLTLIFTYPFRTALHTGMWNLSGSAANTWTEI